MDKTPNDRLVRDPTSSVYAHDALVTPWPIPDQTYDLFIALQVFEHLRPNVPGVWKEVCRVARHAIVSLPISWKVGDKLHQGITTEQALSWFAPSVPSKIVLGNEGKTRREIYIFEDLWK